MTKNEFIDSLREYLSYELPDRLVKSHMQYYNDYFREQLAEGKSAQAVCDELGDPRLIARTIIDSEKAGEDGIPNSGDEPDFCEEMFGEGGEKAGAGFQGADSTSSGNGTRSVKTSDSGSGNGFNIMGRTFGCLPVIIVFLILFGIVEVVLSLIGSIFRGGPVVTVILIALLGYLIYKYFTGRS